MATTAPAHRFDADDFDRIVASGALDNQRVELLDGEIVDMSPPSPQHDTAIERLTGLLAGGAAVLRVQLALHVARDSILVPDVALVERPSSPDRHPTSALLVVEVALSSLPLDRGRKAELYAAAGVPTYWVLDVAGGQVEVHREPKSTGGYGVVSVHRGDDELPLPVAGLAPFTVARLLR